jgi:hypothetical protein
VCTQDDNSSPEFDCEALPNGASIDSVTLSTGNIMRVISRLKLNFSGRPDGFPPLLAKNLSAALEPLSLIFTSFMSVGKIPDDWRRAVVTPVYKSSCALMYLTIDQYH